MEFTCQITFCKFQVAQPLSVAQFSVSLCAVTFKLFWVFMSGVLQGMAEAN